MSAAGVQAARTHSTDEHAPRSLRVASGVFVALVSLLALVIASGLAMAPELLHALNPVTGEPIVLHRGHGVRIPFDAGWSLQGLRRSPIAGALLIALGLALGASIAKLSSARAASWGAARWLAFGSFGAAISWLFPVSYALNVELGDGRTLPENVGNGMTFGAEILTSQLMVRAVRLVASLGHHDAVLGIRVFDTACAFVLCTSVVALADALAESTRGRVLLVLGALLSGASVQVMGYVETTVLELAAIALYAAGVAHVLRGRRAGSGAPWAWTGLSLAVMAHGAGALLLPSAALMVAPRARLWGPRVVRHVALFAVCLVVPFLFIIAPRWLGNDLGNADGGGDHVRFVQADFDRVHPPSPVLYYARFEALHWADLGNALFVAAPLMPLLLLALPWAGRAARPSAAVRALALAALFSFVIPLLWNHDFGMWGDWNLAATYLFPMHLTSWVWLVQTLERAPRDDRSWSLIAASALSLQLAGLAGLALQLY